MARNDVYEPDVFDMDYDRDTFETKTVENFNKAFSAIFKSLKNDESYRYVRAEHIA